MWGVIALASASARRTGSLVSRPVARSATVATNVKGKAATKIAAK